MPLVVIEGVDCSGKQTQAERLYLKFLYEGAGAKRISFPDYDSDSSALVKMYLNGEFGKDAYAVNPYAASTFYAADRYASYKLKWKHFIDNGQLVIADRYVTSNLIHQGVKIENPAERKRYFDWVCDFEYEKLGLPKPDLVLFLHMPPEVSARLMQERANKMTGRQAKDIHESDEAYLQASYENALAIAEQYQWAKIACCEGETLRPVEEISDEIYRLVKKTLF